MILNFLFVWNVHYGKNNGFLQILPFYLGSNDINPYLTKHNIWKK